jgi:biotin carboxyl carrier protein
VSQGKLSQKYPIFSPVFDYRVETQGGTVRVSLGESEIELAVTTEDNQEGLCRTPDGRSYRFFWTWSGHAVQLWVDGELFIFERPAASRSRADREPSTGGSDIVAPMPGTVEQILAQTGDSVERGQTLIIMESMKMELEIASPRAGIVKRVSVEQGAQVDKGMRLIELDELESGS